MGHRKILEDKYNLNPKNVPPVSHTMSVLTIAIQYTDSSYFVQYQSLCILGIKYYVVVSREICPCVERPIEWGVCISGCLK